MVFTPLPFLLDPSPVSTLIFCDRNTKIIVFHNLFIVIIIIMSTFNLFFNTYVEPGLINVFENELSFVSFKVVKCCLATTERCASIVGIVLLHFPTTKCHNCIQNSKIVLFVFSYLLDHKISYFIEFFSKSVVLSRGSLTKEMSREKNISLIAKN